VYAEVEATEADEKYNEREKCNESAAPFLWREFPCEVREETIERRGRGRVIARE
jgi:hypothetical protein